MTKTVDALYDGKVLHPDEPLDLTANTRVRLTVEELAPVTANPQSFLDVALSLNLEGPRDWSENIHHYLYGIGRRDDE